jgi:glycolate oxidase iron-sulfur subunit
VADYGRLLRDDPAYAERAARISAMARDISEVVGSEREALRALGQAPSPASSVAFHSPCSLQHGLKIRGVVEAILVDAGFTLTPVADAHLCCGSAGTYSLLQRDMSERLLADKVTSLERGSPDVIATANIGCLGHIASGATRPVRHWVELVEERVASVRR